MSPDLVHSAALDRALRVARMRVVRSPGDGHHARSCSVCRLGRDRRRELERCYLGWLTPAELAELYGVHASDVQRHAGRFNLDLLRCQTYPLAVGRLMEQAISGHLAAAGALRQVMKDLREIASAGAGDQSAASGQTPEPAHRSQAMTWEKQVSAARRRRERKDRPGPGDAA